MTEAEANKKLKENYKSYFNRTNEITQYAAVIEKSKGVFGIELGIVKKEEITPIFIDKMRKDDPENSEIQLFDDVESGNIIKEETTAFSLQNNNCMDIKRYGITAGTSVFDADDSVSSGTAGAFFRAKNPYKVNGEKEAFEGVFLLSNHHVIASKLPRINKVIHPSKTDTKAFIQTQFNIKIGIKLKKYLVEIAEVCWSSNKNMDVAIAKMTSPVTEGQFSRCNIQFKGIKKPKIGMKVRKCGRTSGLTYGKIRSINCIINVKNTKTNKAFFKKQILTTNMSMKGDSGSVIIDEDDMVVGLLFAGNEKNGSISTDIIRIFKKIKNETTIEFKNFV